MQLNLMIKAQLVNLGGCKAIETIKLFDAKESFPQHNVHQILISA